MSVPLVYVQAVGMACPLGLTAASACAAMRAGIDRKQELPYVDNDGMPLTGSFLRDADDPDERLTRRQRWMRLLVYALQDLLRGQPAALLSRVPILCVLPADLGGKAPDAAAVAEELSTGLGVALDGVSLQILGGGAYGSYRAMADARELLMGRGHSEVLVCAADSLVNARCLLHLHEQQRLLTESNSDGVIPGEAAACLLLGTECGAAPAVIRGLGFGEEPALLSNDVPLRGDGIVAAARAAFGEAALEMHDMDSRLSDAAGEGYQFREQVLAVSRLLRSNKDSFPLRLAAFTLGDAGAAAGLCNVAVESMNMAAQTDSSHRRAIAYASSPAGQRAAVILERVS